MNLYVGNLAFSLSEDELRDAFSDYGTVSSAKIIVDRFSGKSRGFGFVEMDNRQEGQKAIDEANGLELQGKKITVNEARPREQRSGFNSNNNRRQRW